MYIIDKIPEEVMAENFSEYCSKTGGDKAGDGGVFVITKDGKPSGALLSIGEFEDYKAMKNKQYLDKLEAQHGAADVIMMLETKDTTFSQRALGEIMSWAFNDRKILKRIQTLIEDIQRNGLLEGIGKPERLKYEDEERYSRRIDDKNRLVYTLRDGALFIVSCSGHYNE